MPFYEYEPDDSKSACVYCAEGFEELQGINDEALATCPECGAACHRVISTFLVQSGTQNLLGQSNLEKHGFTQYKKAEKGVYEKTAGKGPRIIKDGPK